jgi:hypothetical protein
MPLGRSALFHLRHNVAKVRNARELSRDTAAARFFMQMRESGIDFDTYVDVLPEHKLIYLNNPKCASSTIRGVLSTVQLGRCPPADLLYKRRCSGLRSPSMVGVRAFHSLAIGEHALRFTFVRNPYARLLSAWADKFKGKPLVPGDPYVDVYLKHRGEVCNALLAGGDAELSFPQFARFACATTHLKIDVHWDSQVSRTTIPGINLDLIGKVELFDRDFGRVFDHLGVAAKYRSVVRLLNKSDHLSWTEYYDGSLAKEVHRAYEVDFDTFGYSQRFF